MGPFVVKYHGRRSDGQSEWKYRDNREYRIAKDYAASFIIDNPFPFVTLI